MNKDDYWITYSVKTRSFEAPVAMHAVHVDGEGATGKSLCGLAIRFCFSDAKDDTPDFKPSCRRCRKAWDKLFPENA